MSQDIPDLDLEQGSTDSSSDEDEFPDDEEIVKEAKRLSHKAGIDQKSFPAIISLLYKRLDLNREDKPKLMKKRKLIEDAMKEEKAASTMNLGDPLDGVITSPTNSPKKHAAIVTHPPASPKKNATVVSAPPESFKGTTFQALALKEAQRVKSARSLTWDDPFYDGREDLVAVFDLFQEELIKFWKRQVILRAKITFFAFAVPCPVALYFLLFAIADCYMGGYGTYCWSGLSHGNIEGIVTGFAAVVLFIWALHTYGCFKIVSSHILSQHVAVVKEGIEYTRDDRLAWYPLANGFFWLTASENFYIESKIVQLLPYDQLTMVTVKNPGEKLRENALFPMSSRVVFPFHTVRFDTPTSNTFQYAEVLYGLKYPDELKAVVMEMKALRRDQIAESMVAAINELKSSMEAKKTV